MKSFVQPFKDNPRGTRILAAALLAVVVGAAQAFPPAGQTRDSQMTSEIPAESQIVTGPLEKGNPDYETLLPEGKTIESYGGWTRVSPPNRNPVYAYSDTLNNVPITVSQQPLPDDFKEDSKSQVQQLAAGYAANNELNVPGASAYVGTSAKGPQSVIVLKNRLLILIKASAQIPNSEWEKYIQSLS